MDFEGLTEGSPNGGLANEARVQPFSFACELAHGSNQVRISGFANIPELYQRIAESFSIPVTQVSPLKINISIDILFKKERLSVFK